MQFSVSLKRRRLSCLREGLAVGCVAWQMAPLGLKCPFRGSVGVCPVGGLIDAGQRREIERRKAGSGILSTQNESDDSAARVLLDRIASRFGRPQSNRSERAHTTHAMLESFRFFSFCPPFPGRLFLSSHVLLVSAPSPKTTPLEQTHTAQIKIWGRERGFPHHKPVRPPPFPSKSISNPCCLLACSNNDPT